jgi:hypothetical protein
MADGVEMMMEFLGSTNNEAESEVKRTKGAHVRFIYLKGLITKHLQSMKKAHVEKHFPAIERYKEYVFRAYLLLLVETTIFSYKAKNYVDLT